MLFLGTASGLLYINTLSSIFLSRGGVSGKQSPRGHLILLGEQNTAVLLLSVMNACGRLSLGIISDRYSFSLFSISRFVHRVKRAVFALGAYAILMISYIVLITTDGNEAILPVALLVGFSYGGLYCLIPTMVADLFGVQSFAKYKLVTICIYVPRRNWGTLNLCNAVGALIYGLIAGAIYESAKDVGATSCSGTKCYWPTYVMCMIGIAIAGM